MHTIGLLGGMSWQSSALYYRICNEEVARRLGGLHSARVAMVSVDFDGIAQLQREGAWFEAAVLLSAAARNVEAAGADLLVLCTNTMHKVAEEVSAAVGVPLLHIADATAQRLVADGRRRVGLLGTRYTMEQSFYRDRLEQRHGVEVVVPVAGDRELVDRVIFEELVHGTVEATSRARVNEAIGRLAADGADALILGCTELVLLYEPGAPDATPVLPCYDTTRIHAEVAVDLALTPDPRTPPASEGSGTGGAAPVGPPAEDPANGGDRTLPLAERVELALAAWEQLAPPPPGLDPGGPTEPRAPASHEPAAVVDRLHAAHGEGDLDAVGSLLHADVTWHTGGSVHRGRPDTLSALARSWTARRSGQLLVETGPATGHGPFAVARIRWSATRRGEHASGRLVAVHRVVDGLVVEAHHHLDDEATTAAFWTPPAPSDHGGR